MTKFFIAAIALFSIAAPVSAYTGVYVISPNVVGGPQHVTVTQFDVNTENTNFTTSIETNLTYVQSITIQTDKEMDSHVLIKEYPAGSDQTFDIIVPQPLQNALVSATVTILAPNVDELLVRHEHQGEPTTFEPATKLQPIEPDANGNVLWQFTVTSFSSFTFMGTSAQVQYVRQSMSFAGMLGLCLLACTAIVAPLALRRN